MNVVFRMYFYLSYGTMCTTYHFKKKPFICFAKIDRNSKSIDGTQNRLHSINERVDRMVEGHH